MKALALAAAAAAALGAAAAAAASTRTSSPPLRTRTITVTSITTSVVNHDVKPKGASAGDTVKTRDRLLNAAAQFGKKKGAVVGSDRATIKLDRLGRAIISGRTRLPGGTLILSGTLTPTARGGFVAPVSGGTGRFAHVQGTLTVGPGENRVLNTYRLTTGSGLDP